MNIYVPKKDVVNEKCRILLNTIFHYLYKSRIIDKAVKVMGWTCSSGESNKNYMLIFCLETFWKCNTW
jgi:hypothetical protein